MPPKSHNINLLFHPKKNQKKDQAPATQPKPRPKPPAAVVKKEEDDDEEQFQLPDAPYQEFRLLSSSLKGWKYDVMKFDSRKSVDILSWTPPVKLNRKDLRRQDRSLEAAKVPEAVGPMLGADGKPVLQNGKMVMVDAEGRPIPDSDAAGPSNPKDKAKGANNKKRFQKKTRQVFLVPDDIRRLQREERYPWVIEDSDSVNKELWIGQLEDTQKNKSHAFFMPTANDAFKFVPAHRWYKFQKKLRHEFPTDTAEVESAVCITMHTRTKYLHSSFAVPTVSEEGSHCLARKPEWWQGRLLSDGQSV
jgi:transcription initiation factor TFIIF subunit alpha